MKNALEVTSSHPVRAKGRTRGLGLVSKKHLLQGIPKIEENKKIKLQNTENKNTK